MKPQSETSKHLSEHRPMTRNQAQNAVATMRFNYQLYGQAEMEKVCDALEATLLFHSGPPWDEEKAKRWLELTGTHESTTRNLCDFIRSVLK